MRSANFLSTRCIPRGVTLICLCALIAGPAQALVAETQDFGTVDVGSYSQRIIGECVPLGSVLILGATITGPDASEFQIVDDPCSGHIVNQGECCGMTVRFTPTSTEPKSATLTIYTEFRNDEFPLVGNRLQLEITPNAPADNKYKLQQLPAMPFISATVKVVGVPNAEALTRTTAFNWRTEVRYTPPHGDASDFSVDLPEKRITGGNNPYTPDFMRLIRGGDLTLIVTATIDGHLYEKRTTGLRIVGQNPTQSDLCDALQHNTAGRVANQESSQRQFVDGLPYWSSDGGVGLMQITPPTPDQVWNWRANVMAGLEKLDYGLGVASRYPRNVERSDRFKQLVDRYNAVMRAGQRPLRITVPAFTSSGWNAEPVALGQSELVAIRVYNGVAGSDGFGFALQEFRIATTTINGEDILQVVQQGNRAEAVWERVPTEARPGAGDPDYVNHVLGQPTNCP